MFRFLKRLPIKIAGFLRAWCWELDGIKVVWTHDKRTYERQEICGVTYRQWWRIVETKTFHGPCCGALAHNYCSESIPTQRWIDGTQPVIHKAHWFINVEESE